jgi:hypothetical protein
VCKGEASEEVRGRALRVSTYHAQVARRVEVEARHLQQREAQAAAHAGHGQTAVEQPDRQPEQQLAPVEHGLQPRAVELK